MISLRGSITDAMRKQVAVLIGTVFLLAGCGGSPERESAPPAAAAQAPAPAPTPGPAPTPINTLTISGTPPASAQATVNYQFAPTIAGTNGGTLTFQITNKPAWLSFNATSGALSGTPTVADVGTSPSMVISVTEGTQTATLSAFTIQVMPAPNLPPVISGAPGATVQAGIAYSFQPTASDPESATLVYSIQSMPAWATFSTSTGLLSGTPATNDVGTYTRIIISVSDGRTTVSLPTFSITVSAAPTNGTASLSWTAPSQNTDGSALTDLAGYKIYYGTNSASLNQSVAINTVGTVSYMFTNLNSATTYYFAMTSRNTAGVESGYSNIVTKIIP